MGISGLLPILTSKKIHLQEFYGKVAAVDIHCWLHKSISIHCEDIALKRGDLTRCINSCLLFVNILNDHNITPLLVFDGRKFPLKVVNTERERVRNENLRIGLELWNRGLHNEARKHFKMGVSVGQDLISGLINEC
ncbi:exonuclease 1-like [Dendronephthya gigantea]|uniref:exonuclease 1-like n=1 Tax=Dendronephthya gigantea TaxID=151771 RepID=UPI00106ADCA2|nr:exonuclease 1-like [Dendronephthya gigantea]